VLVISRTFVSDVASATRRKLRERRDLREKGRCRTMLKQPQVNNFFVISSIVTEIDRLWIWFRARDNCLAVSADCFVCVRCNSVTFAFYRWMWFNASPTSTLRVGRWVMKYCLFYVEVMIYIIYLWKLTDLKYRLTNLWKKKCDRRIQSSRRIESRE